MRRKEPDKGPNIAPRRKMRKGYALALAVQLALLAAFAAWLWYNPTAPASTSQGGNGPAAGGKIMVVFEEAPPDPEEVLRRVEEAVFAAFSKAGIPQKDVHFEKSDEGADEPPLIIVKLGDPQKADETARELRSALDGENCEISLVATEKGLELQVERGGRVTHRIRLAHPPGRAAKPPDEPKQDPGKGQKPSLPCLALVIDDMGYGMNPAKKLLETGLKLSFSILPHSTHGAKVARLAAAKGMEVLVHLPMEPRSYPKLDPGPGALLISMPAESLRKMTASNLATVPGAVGANNHMGSLFTENRQALKPVFEVLKGKGLFFLDSYTSPRSVAYRQARSQGLAAARCGLFLDHDYRPQAVRRQILRAIELAQKRGKLIAIGHPHKSTINALTEFAPVLKKDVNMVSVSSLLNPGKAPKGR